VKAILIALGKANTPAAVARLDPRAHSAIRSTMALTCGCRKASKLNSTKRAGAISGKGWKRRFDEPITLPRGAPLVTLQEAGNYITKLPKAVHEAAEWQAAMEALILVVTLGGPTMLRIGVMRALNRHVKRVFNTPSLFLPTR
jgi:hypothetical protein